MNRIDVEKRKIRNFVLKKVNFPHEEEEKAKSHLSQKKTFPTQNSIVIIVRIKKRNCIKKMMKKLPLDFRKAEKK